MPAKQPNSPTAGPSAPCSESFAALVRVDPFTLSAADRVEFIVDLERHAAWFDAIRADALTALAGPGPGHDVRGSGEPNHEAASASPHELFAAEDSVCDEVAAALRVSGGVAGKRITVARDLYYKLPVTRELLRSGTCSYAQASVISDECERLPLRDARKVEARALGRVGSQTPAQTRRAVRRAAASICPPDPQTELDAEFARRDVAMYHDGGVMATITATVPSPDAIAIWNALTVCAHADQVPDDSRTIAHKRADALTAWAHRAFDDPELPTMQGKKRLETQVVIDVATLFGLAENPGEIIGYGPIPAVLARRLAADSDTWRRLVTDTVTGHLLDYGTRTYTPPTSLREYVIARDRVCQFPGCARPGYLCDIDHMQPFTGTGEGGDTSAENLITLCRRHHRLKTHNHWKIDVQKPPDGPVSDVIVQWISPRGVSYSRERPRPLEPIDAAAHSAESELEADLRQRLTAA